MTECIDRGVKYALIFEDNVIVKKNKIVSIKSSECHRYERGDEF
jgi:GR25 family glycosyltransferase involved in LPS biosynthesis